MQAILRQNNYQSTLFLRNLIRILANLGLKSMLIRVKSLIILLGWLLIGTLDNTAQAQDPQFTQFYANPLYLNPAFAGSKRCPRVNLNYRNQWPAIEGQFVTYSASYDQHVDVLSGGLGGYVYQDQAGNGQLNTVNISAIYSYTLEVSQSFSIKAGFQASYFQRSIDWSSLTFGDEIDPRYGFVYETQETPGSDQVNGADFSVGFLGYSDKFYAGFAVHHLSEPGESFFSYEESRLFRKYTLHAGMNIPFNERYPEEGSISPNILYMRQGGAEQLLFGLYGKRGPFVAGLWYRNRDAFIVLVGLQTEKFKFGYSYDITTSDLGTRPGGSHEVSIGYQFECIQKRPKHRNPPCPVF